MAKASGDYRHGGPSVSTWSTERGSSDEPGTKQRSWYVTQGHDYLRALWTGRALNALGLATLTMLALDPRAV
jgi:hypothetical protein